MAATSDKELESLVRNFEQIYQRYKDALVEIQSLKLSYSSEAKKCEALESSCNDLKADNERLRRLNAETLSRFSNQMRWYAESQSVKTELQKASSRLCSLEEEHKNTVEIFKQENELKIHELEKQLSCSLLGREEDKATIKQLQLDLAAHDTHVSILKNKLEQITADVNMKYQYEIQELRDLIMVEQEEKYELTKKLQNAENELQLIKLKQAEQQRDSISIRHVETLKQKIMKLRKENESLKRQLVVSELDSA